MTICARQSSNILWATWNVVRYMFPHYQPLEFPRADNEETCEYIRFPVHLLALV